MFTSISRMLVIPGSPKPSLFKAGAGKLCDIYGFTKIVEVTNRREDWDKPFLHYEITVRLTNKRTGFVDAEGVGSCNSREKKYVRQDTYTLANTLLKMAKKRALVDAVLSATRSSGIFSQDLEDMNFANASQSDTPSASQGSTASPPDPATVNQLKKVYALVRQFGLSSDSAATILEERYGVSSSQQLNKKQASDLIKHLLETQTAPATHN